MFSHSQADKEKKKKVKKKEDKKEDEPTPAPTPEPAAPAPAPAEAPKPAEPVKSPSESVRASRGSKKAVKRSGSSVFSMFSQKQLAEFKEGFTFMDHDKDGIIKKADLRFAFDQIGRVISDRELDDMLNEVSGPMNYTQMLQLFGSKLSGGGEGEKEIFF